MYYVKRKASVLERSILLMCAIALVVGVFMLTFTGDSQAQLETANDQVAQAAQTPGE